MSNNLRKCTMCDTIIDLDLNQEKTKCPCCGTEFITSNLALYGVSMFDEKFYNPFDEQTIVPKSYFEEMKALEKAKNDEKIYDLAYEIAKKYPADESAQFLAAIALGNLLIRRILSDPDTAEDIVSNGETEKTLKFEEIFEIFDNALLARSDKGLLSDSDGFMQYMRQFIFMKEFAYLDNAINSMSNYLKSKNKEHLLYGENSVAFTESEIKAKEVLAKNNEIKEEIKNGTRKKQHFFSKNIFVSLGLIACIFVVVCAVLHPFVPAITYFFSGAFYDWVALVLAVLILFARLGYVAEANGEEVVSKEKSIEEKNTANKKSLIEITNEYREQYGKQYWLMFDFENLDDEEEFKIKAYAKYIIIFRMLKTDLVNNIVDINDSEFSGYLMWDRYACILDYKESWLEK